MINSDQIAYTVFRAVEDGKYLPIGESISLEHLTNEDDGIFPSKQSWRSFVRGNFLEGEYFVDTVKESTIKKWCYPAKEYINRFVVQVGQDKYIPVAPEDIVLLYSYECMYWSDRTRQDGTVPDIIELYVTASIRS